MKVDNGYLIIADITGYTSFLSQTELEHAHDILQQLIRSIIDEVKAPLIISRLQGDAVITYALDGSVVLGQTLLEAIEGIYYAFAGTLRDMIVNTTCTCNACRLMPTLDLKFVVHHGKFSQQQLGDYVELLGNDVNVSHRLLKNSVPDATGVTAYVLFSDAALKAMGVDPAEEEMIPHSESYADVGEQAVFVHDMKARWQTEQQRRVLRVDPDEALRTITFDLPVDVVTAWEFLTAPEYRTVLVGADSHTISGRNRGRTGPGSTYHCAHGEGEVLNFIQDWHPFDYYTFSAFGLAPNTEHLFTLAVTPTEDGTRVTYIVSSATGPLLARRRANTLMEKMVDDMIPPALVAFSEYVASEAAKRGVGNAQQTSVSQAAIDAAAREGLPAEG